MQYKLVFSLLGLLLTLFSLSMLLPAIVAVIYAEDNAIVFISSFLLTCMSGGALWLSSRSRGRELRTRDGFLLTALFWTVLGLFGALPFYLDPTLQLSLSNAVFESMSGLTTTGATVIIGLDDLPKSLLYYRQQLQWLGGIGIIVIAIAILPMLGVGGMQLYRAETPGPMNDKKLTPRIAGTAKVLFLIYLIMTLACAFCYWLAGMDTFDAICHSFSTVAIGGFSTYDASLGYFESDLILWVGIIFMLLAGANFGIHYFAFREQSLARYWRDPELRFFYSLLLFAVAIVFLSLVASSLGTPNAEVNTAVTASDTFTHAAFQVVSLASTTGFASTDYTAWPLATTVFMFLLATVGACAGSTGGGMKAIRVMLILKQGYREIVRLVHPNAIITIKLGNRPVKDSVIAAVWSFFAIYIMTLFVLFMAVLTTGLDFLTAFSAVSASINNLGPGLGGVSANYTDIPNTAKWILCFAMLIGRLEVFTLLVLFTPAFWKK